MISDGESMRFFAEVFEDARVFEEFGIGSELRIDMQLHFFARRAFGDGDGKNANTRYFTKSYFILIQKALLLIRIFFPFVYS